MKLGGADTKLPNSKTHRMPSFFWLPQGIHRLLFISVIFGNSYTTRPVLHNSSFFVKKMVFSVEDKILIKELRETNHRRRCQSVASATQSLCAR